MSDVRQAEEATPLEVDAFIDRWGPSGGSERANYQLFLSELCALLGVQKPGVSTSDAMGDPYFFERPVSMQKGDGSTSTGYIDLYKKGCFVCEAKQGSDKKTKGYGGQEVALGLETKPRIKSGTAIRGQGLGQGDDQGQESGRWLCPRVE